jgi:hypothetical protein
VCNVATHACVLGCTPETQAQSCAPGQVCAAGRCSDCASDLDCPGSLVCNLDRLQCSFDGEVRCLSDRDCAVGQVCNRATGSCTLPPPPCSSSEDCLAEQRCELASGRCLLRACQPDRYEPNGDASRGPLLGPGEYLGLTLCDFEEDWYALALTRGDRLSVFVDADPLLEATITSRLLDGAGRTLASGALSVDWVMSEEAVFFLAVRSSDPFVPYGLRLAVTHATPCDADALEANDTPAAATPVTATTTLAPLTLCAGDVDLFRLEVPAGQGVRVTMEYVPTEGVIDLRLLSAEQRELARAANAQPKETLAVSAEEAAAGPLLLEVRPEGSSAHDTYLLRVEYSSDAPDASGP